MFMIGQQIQVVLSSQRATGAKIRVGSTGFVSNIYGSVFLEKSNVSLMCCDVVFNRYGFEKRQRCESKKVVMIFPSKEPFLNEIKIKPILNKILKSVLDSTATVLNLFQHNVLNKKPVFIVVTNINTDIYSSKELHRSWFLSICNNKDISYKYYAVRDGVYDNYTILFEKFKNLSDVHSNILDEFLISKTRSSLIRLADLYYKYNIEGRKEYVDLINLLKIYVQLINISNIALAKRTLHFYNPLFFNIITALYLLMNNKIGPFKNNQILMSHKSATQRVAYWLNKINEIDLTKP